MISTTHRQQVLPLPLPRGREYSAVLVQTDTAMATLGLSRETVLGMVDDGSLRWVFDVSLRREAGPAAAPRRELRFWTRELDPAGALAGLSLPLAIDLIVGRELMPELRATTVRDILCLQPQQVQRLVHAGELRGRRDGHPCWIERASVVDFLRRRWV